MTYDAANSLPAIGGNVNEGVVTTNAAIGAFTQIIVDMSHAKNTNTIAAFWGVKPGNNDLDSSIVTCAAANNISASTITALARSTFGTIYACSGFLNAGGLAPASTGIDRLMCVGEFSGAGRISTIDVGNLAAVDTTTYLGTNMSTLVVPSGGIANFKGVTSAVDYVVQKCFSIAPVLANPYT